MAEENAVQVPRKYPRANLSLRWRAGSAGSGVKPVSTSHGHFFPREIPDEAQDVLIEALSKASELTIKALGEERGMKYPLIVGGLQNSSADIIHAQDGEGRGTKDSRYLWSVAIFAQTLKKNDESDPGDIDAPLPAPEVEAEVE